MAGMEDVGITIEDGRPASERLPTGLTDVQRTLDNVNLQVVGDVAIFTSRMAERTVNASIDSYISHMWVRRGTMWQPRQVRLVSTAALNRVVR